MVKSDEMKAYDKDTIQKIGIPSLVLMERAALVTVDEIEKCRRIEEKVLVVAGNGNNGGDGLAIGRILALKGAEVTFLLAGSREKATQETSTQIRIIENLGFSIQSKLENEEYDMVIDALFGIGLSRNVEGNYLALIEELNRMKDRGAYICSVDIPSGICADTGKIMGCAVKADLTVSYAYAKRGHLLYPGKTYAGILKVRDIGIPEQLNVSCPATAFTYEKQEINQLLPKRRADGNKGTFGKVILFAGSCDMCGACLICAESIMRAGAGMVKIVSPVCNREVIQRALPEAMLLSYEGQADEAELMKSLQWADVLVAGPGIGTREESLKILRTCLESSKIPAVLDADALNLLSENAGLQKLILEQKGRQIVLTPHPGELTRLLQMDMEQYRNNREEMIKMLVERYGCIVAAKDAVTIVAAAGKEQIYINTSGNDGMATAGSGDALAGIIGGLIAQRMEGFEAAALGVFLHGLAGEAAAERNSKYGVMATDIVKELPLVMNQL